MPMASKIILVTSVLLLAIAGSAALLLKRRIQTTEYCASCHLITPYYNTWRSSEFLAHTHQKVGIVCQDCHARTFRNAATELARYVTQSYQLPLKDHRVR